MTPKEELAAVRQRIDTLDEALIQLFLERMRLADTVADIKTRGNLALMDEGRERKVIERAMAFADSDEERGEAAGFISGVMAQSKLRQRKTLLPGMDLSFPAPRPPKTESLRTAYQGVAGAWGQKAARTLYPNAETIGLEDFEEVFLAVKDGRADYGVLPIENSRTGAIGEVYDLLRRHACYIVGMRWITVAQCLLGLPGTRTDEVREVLSHPEGLKQCRRFLKGRAWDLTACRNTAVAAETVALRKEKRLAAIGSRLAAEIYGLEVLTPDIMDDPNNKTRFIALASAPEYDGLCDATSITFSTEHVSGALCSVLQTFMAAGINLSRIESRPASAGRYRFFADLQANAGDLHTAETLRKAAQHCDYFEILGCYQS